jgi:hypothetical protein
LGTIKTGHVVALSPGLRSRLVALFEHPDSVTLLLCRPSQPSTLIGLPEDETAVIPDATLF